MCCTSGREAGPWQGANGARYLLTAPGPGALLPAASPRLVRDACSLRPPLPYPSAQGRGGRAEDDAARRETAFGRAAALLQENSGHLPSLVVLDLDYTIWPYYCEYYGPKDPATLYPDVLGIIHAVHAAGIPMAIASKSPATPTALGMLR